MLPKNRAMRGIWMIPNLDTRSASSTSKGRYKGSTPLSRRRVLPGVRIIAKWGQVSQLTLRWSKFADGRSSIVEGRQTDNRTLENWRDI